jgi:protein involved in polysaccharide export with SLBB domain
LAEAAEAIRQEGMRRDIYRDPTVALAFGVRAMNRITVDGAVEKPGTYELPAGSSTLSAALAAAGGLNKEATRFVEIQYPTSRGPAGGMEVNQVGYHPSDAARNSVGHDGLVRVDIFEAQYSPGGAASLNHYLRDGAVVTVVQTPPRFVTVMGQTGNRVLALAPERETRMLDAIAEVGGPKYSIWIADKVKVFRRVPGSDETITIAASMRRDKKDIAENLLLTSGDMVSVEENPLTFTMDTVSKLLGVGVAATQAAYYGL